jgi:hypothetical protein
MSIKFGNSIVTKDIVLHLNASSQKNYVLSEVEVLIVGGGGGGASGHAGGGGGGGGVIYRPAIQVVPGTVYSITVGNGGSQNTNGQPSFAFNLTALGGGTGGLEASRPGVAGGSGGGGAGDATTSNRIGGAGTPGQGQPGGNGNGDGINVAGNPYGQGGGGGGAGQRGFDATTLAGGRGGDGLQFNISGTPTYYGGGGGGGGWSATVVAVNGLGGRGGGGGGGEVSSGVAGTPNTGGGGGGTNASATRIGGAGGTGVVIVRYPGPQKATGGNTITQVGGYTIHTFTSSGTFTPLSAPVNGGTAYGLQDLSGKNITLTQSGGVTYSTANGGAFVFDGVNDLLISTPTPLLLQGNPNITVIGFYRRTGNFAGRGFWGIGGSNVGGIGQGINNWNNANTNEIAIDSWGQSTFTTGQTYPLNTWIGVAWRKIAGPMTRANCIISIFNGTTLTHYTSTSLTVLRGEAASNLVINSIGGLTIGSISVDTGYCSPVNIGSHCIYNRVLTDVEIQQNFNAQRGRFGI